MNARTRKERNGRLAEFNPDAIKNINYYKLTFLKFVPMSSKICNVIRTTLLILTATPESPRLGQAAKRRSTRWRKMGGFK